MGLGSPSSRLLRSSAARMPSISPMTCRTTAAQRAAWQPTHSSCAIGCTRPVLISTVETYSFKGPAVYDGTKARDLKVENEADGKFSQIVTNGWIASLQHHFVSAIVPQAGQPTTLKLQVQGQEYLLSATGPIDCDPGRRQDPHRGEIVHRPQAQEQLAAAGPRLDLTDRLRSRSRFLPIPCFVTLKWIHGLVGNWGWAIIIVTALIKLLFYPLSRRAGAPWPRCAPSRRA